ncbi:hypothetical protein G7Y79_00014g037560 [Physcia stellaris]|nr:hypothetical protein G7Y79_00014g037560 [Physcia stellaris]
MRLIHTSTLSFHEFLGDHNVPLYAILSHVWEEEEVSYHDFATAESPSEGFDSASSSILQSKVQNWLKIGIRKSLADHISTAAGFAFPPIATSVDAKMSWAPKRETTRPEDIAYCLLGLFDVNMPLLYGEGDKAFLRLQQEIIKSSNDQFIFAWTREDSLFNGIIAYSPADFKDSTDVMPCEMPGLPQSPYSIMNLGIRD